jgi:hypothetical protein
MLEDSLDSLFTQTKRQRMEVANITNDLLFARRHLSRCWQSKSLESNVAPNTAAGAVSITTSGQGNSPAESATDCRRVMILGISLER